MTFRQAYKYAMKHSEVFRNHDAAVKKARKEKRQSACMAFSVSPNEAFYYGFDGCEMHKGKYLPETAAFLAKAGMLYIVL